MTRKKGFYNCNNSADDLNLTKEERQAAGAFHTPKPLAMEMAKRLYPEYIKYKTKAEIAALSPESAEFIKHFNLIDPCCGTGNLLAAALNVYKWIEEEDIYGVDIDHRAIEFCLKKFPHGHFQVGDCLTEDIASDKFWENEPRGMFGQLKTQQLLAAKQVLKNKSKTKKLKDATKKVALQNSLSDIIKTNINE